MCIKGDRKSMGTKSSSLQCGEKESSEVESSNQQDVGKGSPRSTLASRRSQRTGSESNRVLLPDSYIGIEEVERL